MLPNTMSSFGIALSIRRSLFGFCPEANMLDSAQEHYEHLVVNGQSYSCSAFWMNARVSNKKLSRVIEEPDSKEPMECPAEKQKYLIY
jgi:hypothetical protein